jgi:hypothetical protein
MLDGGRRFSRLMKGPVVVSKGSRPFTLKGRVIEMYGAARRWIASSLSTRPTRSPKEFTVISDTLDLRITSSKLNRAFAFGPSGARATTSDRDIIADSLDIIMPDQRIRELRAIGKAFAESDPDTVRIRSEERDWIRGDTLIARFDSVAAADTTQPPIRDLFAAGEASAYYRLAADGVNRSRPGINYVTGRIIRLVFKDRSRDSHRDGPGFWCVSWRRYPRTARERVGSEASAGGHDSSTGPRRPPAARGGSVSRWRP